MRSIRLDPSEEAKGKSSDKVISLMPINFLQQTVDDEKKGASKQSQRKASFDVGKAYAQRTGSSSLTLLESIDTKLQDLINQMQAVSDPLRLKQIFEAIEAGARAKKACLEVEKSF